MRFYLTAAGLDSLAQKEALTQYHIFKNRYFKRRYINRLQSDPIFSFDASHDPAGSNRLIRAAANAQMRINRARNRARRLRFRKDVITVAVEEAFRSIGASAQISQDLASYGRLIELVPRFPLPFHPRIGTTIEEVILPSKKMKYDLYSLLRTEMKSQFSPLRARAFVNAFYLIYISLMREVVTRDS